MLDLIGAAVPEPIDRIDFTELDRPMEGVSAPSLDALQPLVRERIAEDLRRHVDERHTPYLGAFVAMLSVYGETTRLAGSGALSARSQASDMGWWQGFFNSVASGPPGFRVRQLLALSRAGYLRFLGPGMWVDVDEDGFRAGSTALDGAPPVTSTVLVDARLPDPSASRSVDGLVAGLLRRGELSEEILTDDDGTVLRNTGQIRVRPADGAVIDASGAVHERRFAVGPHTVVRVAGAFTRPGMNAQSLRYNDAVARAALTSLATTRNARRQPERALRPVRYREGSAQAARRAVERARVHCAAGRWVQLDRDRPVGVRAFWQARKSSPLWSPAQRSMCGRSDDSHSSMQLAQSSSITKYFSRGG